MSANEHTSRVAAVFSYMEMNPSRRLRHVINLIFPTHFRQQPIIDDRHPDSMGGEKSADVPVHIRSANPQALVPSGPASAMDKNEDRPIPSTGKKEIQLLFGGVCFRPIRNVIPNLRCRQISLLV